MSGPTVLDSKGNNIVRDYHGKSWVSIILCPKICSNRLAHFSFASDHSWVISDYISALKLRRSPPPNQSFSSHSLADIGAEILYSVFPPRIENKDSGEWKTYLSYRTSAVLKEHKLGASNLTSKPNQDFGKWKEL